MALMNVKFFSEALGMQTEVLVVMPQRSTHGEIGIDRKTGQGKYRCLYLLHGLSDDQSIWLRRTSIERYADRYGLCVVMPRADKSYYCDMKYGLRYYTYIAQELPRLICEFFPVSDAREDTFVAGLSMGGYGALKIALRECDRFAAGAGLSPVADVAKRAEFRGLFKNIFGDELEVPPEDDLLYLAEQQANRPDRPRLYIGIGTEDFLYQDNQPLCQKLTEKGYDFTYRESPGAHTWEFWDEYIQYVLEWMLGSD